MRTRKTFFCLAAGSVTILSAFGCGRPKDTAPHRAPDTETTVQSNVPEAAPDTEMTLPEEALYERMRAGEVAAAREGFLRLLGKRLKQLEEVMTTPAASLDALDRQRRALAKAMLVVRFIQLAETELRLDPGTPTPDVILSQVLHGAETVAKHLPMIDQAAQRLGIPSAEEIAEWSSRQCEIGHEERDIRDALERLPRRLLETLVFLQGTSVADRRGDILAVVRRYARVPPTLEQFDSEYDDLASALDLDVSARRTHELAAAPGPPETPSETPPYCHEVYRLYEAGELAEARRVLLETVRRDAEASIAMNPSRRIDLATKLGGIGVLANCVSYCIDLEQKHGDPAVFPPELREAARLTREAVKAVVEEVEPLVAGDESSVARLAYIRDQKTRLLVREINAFEAAGEVEQARTLANQYAGFLRSRGIPLGGTDTPVVRKPGAPSLSAPKGTETAGPGARGGPRSTIPGQTDAGASSIAGDAGGRAAPVEEGRKGSGLSDAETSFWATLVDGDVEALERFYAERITLKAGSELLKPRWGIASDRGKDTTFARNELMVGYGRMIEEFGRDRWREAFSKIGEDKLTAAVITEPGQPFTGTRQGDRLLTVKTGVGDDRLFYVFRREGAAWRIVIEATDY